MVTLAATAIAWAQQAWTQGASEPTGRSAQISESAVQREVSSPSSAITHSQYTPRQLSITEAVHQAIDWHPVIAESVGELYRRQEGIRVARSGYFPQLSAGVVAGHDSENNGGGDGHAVQLYVSQVIYDFGKISSGVDLANAEVSRSRAEVLQSIDRIARDTADAAVEVQRYQALLETSQEQIDSVSAIASLVRMRSERGASSRSDVLQAQARIEAARAAKQQVIAGLARWRSTLQNLVNASGPVQVTMGTPESMKNACQGPPGEIFASPRILIAEASRAEAMARLSESRADVWPTLSLDASYNRYLDQTYVDTNVLDENESAVFLNLSMPIYQGGRLSASKESASYAVRAAEAAKDAARESVAREYQAAQAQAHGLERSMTILDAREKAIRETRDLYRKQYSSLGTRTLLDLLNAEEELQQARQERIETRFDLKKLEIECLYNTGDIRQAFGIEGRAVQGVEVLP
ncbi:outer membrane protein, adhesin transport system [Microbulbifer yueqingensis]|uniref:Outer membrane protein, adhesin transport system n=2 Tax=Microbulbifer yueqingensis TaxID=658219 RepID=A0A1G9E5S4_9GAMM|nr:outer membrane protein, adhesin transport system [Microbulbifer yueqingensis]